MSFATLFGVVALATFALAVSAVSAAVPLIWRWRRPADSASARAWTTLSLRALPTASAVAAAAFAAAAFARFEPRGREESAGIVMLILALSGLALLAGALVRLLRIHLRTRRVLRGWMASASPILLPGAPIPAFAVDAEFPIVAVVGIFRPRLILARSVIERCSAEELDAVLAHERGHLLRRDNARRALLQSLPDVLAWLPIARQIDRAWHEATEEAADDLAVETSASMRVHLASALVRVARLAHLSAPVTDLPASALYRGEPLEYRIRRLLILIDIDNEPAPRPSRGTRVGWRLAAAASMTGAALISLNLGTIHDLVEAAITFLP